jgi:ABC-type cobalamin transport system ATPase subunit
VRKRLDATIDARAMRDTVSDEQPFHAGAAGVVAARIDLHSDDLAVVKRCHRLNPRVANEDGILADEPTGNLDTKNGIEVMNLLSELNQEGATILVVTHSVRDAGFAHRTINLFDGRVIIENQN